jgi:signal transduction histidine kinase
MLQTVHTMVPLAALLAAARAGAREAAARRVAFLCEMKNAFSVRLSAQDALAQKLWLTCRFFRADACMLVARHFEGGPWSMHRVAHDKAGGEPPIPISEEAACALFEAEQRGRLAELLETTRFATVPFRRRQRVVGRLYLLSASRGFARREVRLLARAADCISIAVDCHAMLDELKLDAVRAERRRISRDLHDSTIQPYIGLKYGIEALYRQLDPRSRLARRVKELLETSSSSVDELRSYAARLRDDKAGASVLELPARLRAHADRYRALWGLEVDVRLARDLQLSERMAAETYQLACEALSNVCRHTRATRAFVDLRRIDSALVLEVGNERCPESPTQPFMPRSIAERASALGGGFDVRLDAHGHDVVRVSMPMP